MIPQQMAFAGLIGQIRHSTIEQFLRFVYHPVPLKRRAGVDLVGLNVVMAEHALIIVELGPSQGVGDELTFFAGSGQPLVSF